MRERFLRLAPKRTSRALKALSSVEALGNRTSYYLTPDEAMEILDALRERLEGVRRALLNERTEKNHSFEFSGNTPMPLLEVE